LVEGKGIAFAKKQISDDLFQVRKGELYKCHLRCCAINPMRVLGGVC
jgi:hypothetical protein